MRWSRLVRAVAVRRHPREGGYTGFVGCWQSRAVSFVMVFALAGAPAVLVGCAALCMPGMTHGSSMEIAGTVDSHAAHGSMPLSHAAADEATTDKNVTRASGHHSSLAQQSEQPRSALRAEAVASAIVSERNCCSSDDTVLTALVTAVRADTGTLLATTPVLATTFRSLRPLGSRAKFSLHIPPLTPIRALLVLRV